jgi:hypothetical protein
MLIGQAESHVQGSSMLLKHTLWQVMNNSISMDSLLSDELRNLSWEVQRILYKANKYDCGSALVTHLSKRKLRQLECLAGLDALAAQIIFFKLAILLIISTVIIIICPSSSVLSIYYLSFKWYQPCCSTMFI